MKIRAIDLNIWYTLDFDINQWVGNGKNNAIDCVSLELNNLLDDDEDNLCPVPNETTFNMSMDDVIELHAWLGIVLDKYYKREKSKKSHEKK